MAEQPLSDLAREITGGAVRLAAATAAWLRLVAEFDRREGWHLPGVLSCAHWLAWQCGMSPGTAREHVRVARALTDLPRISTAFAEGRLSYSKVRALTRVAEPDTEESLLDLALETTASQTERVVREWRRSDRLEAGVLARRRRFDWRWDDDGMLVLTLRLEPDEGARLVNAIESVAEREARRERAAGKRAIQAGTAPPCDAEAAAERDEVALARERATARRCAALVRLAEISATADRRPGDPPRREVVVHVDAAVAADDAAAGRAFLEGGPALHAAQVRRLLCEATVVTMLEHGREVLDAGRTRRLATRAQRRALLRRDGGCARPSCPEARLERLHAHHMRHWLHGGRTDLANLVLLCDACHGLVHDHDLVITRRRGRLVVTTPAGRQVWGPADAAFAGGVETLDVAALAFVPTGEVDAPGQADVEFADPFAGVEPIDQRIGRRPLSPAAEESLERYRSAALASVESAGGPAASVGELLFPAGEPDVVESAQANGERMNLRWVVGVLRGNRDVGRLVAAHPERALVPAA